MERPTLDADPPVPPPKLRMKLWETILIGGVGAVLVIFFTWAVAIAAAFVELFRSGPPALDSLTANVQAVAFSKPVLISSMIATSTGLIFVALLGPKITRVRLRTALGINPAPWPAYVAIGFGILGLGPIADLLMRAVSKLLPDWSMGNMEMITELILGIPVWAAVPLVAIMPAVSEELFFRGMLQRGLGTGIGAAIAAGLAFSLFHLDPHHVAGVLPIGIYLSWVAYYTGSTLVPIVGHFLNNLLALIQVHVIPLQVGEGTDEPLPWWAIPIGVAITSIASAAIVISTRRMRAKTSTS